MVALTGNIPAVADELNRLGYDVVDYAKHKGYIDAIVYKGEALQTTNISASNITGDQPGVLMINADNITPKQIHQILQSRVYSPLF